MSEPHWPGDAAAPLLRTMLYVPSDRPRMVAKAPGLDADADADAVILDLEDAVAPAKKAAARDACVAAVQDWPASAPQLWVRINPIGTVPGFDDLRGLDTAGMRRLVIPKIDLSTARASAAALADVSAAVEEYEIVGLVETARGVVDVAALRDALPQLVALQFGAEDFTADMGIGRTADGVEIAYARSALAVAARAQDLAAIDTPLTEYRDLDAVRRDARTASALGFTGKACIHPAQLAPVRETFTPSPDEVAHAQRVLEALDTAKRLGQGTTSVDGRMIDAPVAARARSVLARARIPYSESTNLPKGTH